jgi:hypothetical protein
MQQEFLFEQRIVKIVAHQLLIFFREHALFNICRTPILFPKSHYTYSQSFVFEPSAAISIWNRFGILWFWILSQLTLECCRLCLFAWIHSPETRSSAFPGLLAPALKGLPERWLPRFSRISPPLLRFYQHRHLWGVLSTLSRKSITYEADSWKSFKNGLHDSKTR